MHDLTGRIANIAVSYVTGKPILTLEVDEDKETLLHIFEGLKAAEKLTIKLGKYRKKRSLDANAYFHLLVNKIAAKLKTSDEEVKRNLVCSYGVLARDENGELIGAMLPAGVDVERFYPYTRNYKTVYQNGKEYNCYLFYERTRDLNTADMARLIEGTISEAKSLGIETKCQEEVDSLLRQWG